VDITNLANQFPLFMVRRGFAASTSSPMCRVRTRAPAGFPRVRAVMPPSSRHPGGVNLLMGDGSVRFTKIRSISRSGVRWAQFPVVRSSARQLLNEKEVDS